jgi:hypothetical protein
MESRKVSQREYKLTPKVMLAEYEREIGCSQSGEDVDVGLLGSKAV